MNCSTSLATIDFIIGCFTVTSNKRWLAFEAIFLCGSPNLFVNNLNNCNSASGLFTNKPNAHFIDFSFKITKGSFDRASNDCTNRW